MSPRIASFQWDVENLSHIARHGVTQSEVEEAFQDPYALLEGNVYRKGELRYRMMGQTNEGQLLTVVFIIRVGQIRCVTAHSTKGRRLRQYNAGRLK